MPRKPNYDFEKRRKELARKQKQEEKRARKRDDEALPEPPVNSTTVAPGLPTPE